MTLFAASFAACAASVSTTTSPPVSTSNGAATAPATADEALAIRWAWTSIGCFVGGPWSEALGARPEDRIAADVVRCRDVVSGPLRAAGDDAAALAAVRGLDPATVQRVVDAIGEEAAGMGERKTPLLTFIRASADAAREAMMARRVSEAIRLDLAAKDGPKATAEMNDGRTALTARSALAALQAIGTDDARVVALILAADHVEAARGLPPAAKLLAASPAFDVVLSTPLPEGAFDYKAGAWLAYVRAAAKAAGHPAELGNNAATNDVERLAFAGVASGFADRFEALVPKVQGAPHDVAAGYAESLRAALADAEAKAKAKVEAKKTTDEAVKKSKQ
ncbi:MAG: hypothetical protein ABI175_15545 [Polyangiales bacterium]